MAKLHEVRCWISDHILGIGETEDEALMNALNGEGVSLLVEGGGFKEVLTVHRNAIEAPTVVRVITADASAVRVDGYRTINVGVNTLSVSTQEIAENIVNALHGLNRSGIIVIELLAAMKINLGLPAAIIDLDEADDAMLASAHQQELKEPSKDQLLAAAKLLTGPTHSVGEPVPQKVAREDQYAYSVRWSFEDSAFVASVQEFPSLKADGPSMEGALAELRNVVRLALEDIDARGPGQLHPTGC